MLAVTRLSFVRRGAHVTTTLSRSASMFGQARWIAERPDVRNIAVIAHVDHGKTTLVDSLLKHSGTLTNARNRVMDSNDQEKERGITILAKNTAIVFPDGRRVNIVDTPGHLDFSGEVERALQMVEGFILLVDAAEGVKPGTRYVLRKALTLGLHPIVCINKIDKADERIAQVVEQVQELFLETAVSDDQLDMYFLYGSGRDGYFNDQPKREGDMTPLFNAMFNKIPAPKQAKDQMPLQLLVALVDETAGGNKVAIGRIFQGDVKVGDVVKVVLGEERCDALVKNVLVYRGVEKEPVASASVGDVVWVELQEPLDQKINLKIGGSLCDKDDVQPWPYRAPDEPTYSLKMTKNNAPWAGKEAEGNPLAKMMELRKVLRKQEMVDQALRIENIDGDEITLHGRGPLHLGVLIESLRRMGFEFELRAPSVVRRQIDGEWCEPFEKVTLEYPQANSVEVIKMVSEKYGEMVDINTVADRVTADFTMPVRMMTDISVRFNKITGGRGVITHAFDGYKPEIPVESQRSSGTMCAIEDGTVQEYSLQGLTQNGRFFVQHGENVYFSQIVGENTQVAGQDMPVNPTKKNEQIGGFRANAMDKAKKRTANEVSTSTMGLEDYLGWVNADEVVTVTPKSVRARLPMFQGKTIQRGKTKSAGTKKS